MLISTKIADRIMKIVSKISKLHESRVLKNSVNRFTLLYLAGINVDLSPHQS